MVQDFFVLFEPLALQNGLLVAAVVVFVFCVALDPVALHIVRITKGEKCFPEVGVQGGLLSDLTQPRAFQPRAQPFSKASMTYLESE